MHPFLRADPSLPVPLSGSSRVVPGTPRALASLTAVRDRDRVRVCLKTRQPLFQRLVEVFT